MADAARRSVAVELDHCWRREHMRPRVRSPKHPLSLSLYDLLSQAKNILFNQCTIKERSAHHTCDHKRTCVKNSMNLALSK